ncbi:hypothetical protein MRB53_037907 [Persea americana]|nr:hypothetical protein MRB53_037907 [Persea americana]
MHLRLLPHRALGLRALVRQRGKGARDDNRPAGEDDRGPRGRELGLQLGLFARVARQRLGVWMAVCLSLLFPRTSSISRIVIRALVLAMRCRSTIFDSGGRICGAVAASLSALHGRAAACIPGLAP